MSSPVSAHVLFLTTCTEVVFPSLDNIHVNRIYGPLTGAHPSSFSSNQKTYTLYVGNQGQIAPVDRACETEACVCSSCRFGFDGTVGGTKCRGARDVFTSGLWSMCSKPKHPSSKGKQLVFLLFPPPNVHLFTRTRCPFSLVWWIVCYKVKALDFSSQQIKNTQREIWRLLSPSSLRDKIRTISFSLAIA